MSGASSLKALSPDKAAWQVKHTLGGFMPEFL